MDFKEGVNSVTLQHKEVWLVKRNRRKTISLSLMSYLEFDLESFQR